MATSLAISLAIGAFVLRVYDPETELLLQVTIASGLLTFALARSSISGNPPRAIILKCD
jgi:hypothetical protein